VAGIHIGNAVVATVQVPRGAVEAEALASLLLQLVQPLQCLKSSIFFIHAHLNERTIKV
jgi:hypothetical protein